MMPQPKPIFSYTNLHRFMLRLDRVTPLPEFSTVYPAILAAAALQAFLEFIELLDAEAAPPQTRLLLITAIGGFQASVFRFQNCLLNHWISGKLTSSSKSSRETLDEIYRAYREAANFGRVILSLILPCSIGWYDGAMGKES